MKKIIAIAATLLTLTVVKVWAASHESVVKLMPLQEYARSNPANDHSANYVSYRCAALFTVLSELAKGTLRKTMQAKAIQFLEFAEKFQARQAELSKAEAEKRLMKTVGLMVAAYTEAANRNYVARGEYVAGNVLIEGDVAFCAQIGK